MSEMCYATLWHAEGLALMCKGIDIREGVRRRDGAHRGTEGHVWGSGAVMILTAFQTARRKRTSALKRDSVSKPICLLDDSRTKDNHAS